MFPDIDKDPNPTDVLERSKAEDTVEEIRLDENTGKKTKRIVVGQGEEIGLVD